MSLTLNPRLLARTPPGWWASSALPGAQPVSGQPGGLAAISRGLRSAGRDDTPGTSVKVSTHPEGMLDPVRMFCRPI